MPTPLLSAVAELQSPRVYIFLDDNGNIHIEAPGHNGHRKKIELEPNEQLPQSILAELETQRDQRQALLHQQRAQQLKSRSEKDFKVALMRHRRMHRNMTATQGEAAADRLLGPSTDLTTPPTIPILEEIMKQIQN